MVLFCWPEEASSLANDGLNKSTRATIVATLSFDFARAPTASGKGMAVGGLRGSCGIENL
ncbi:MAG: hypothetical protein IKI67_04930 [Bacteroidales bacterium]|nr:hypothetical protein [Bacteroidales bacterium]